MVRSRGESLLALEKEKEKEYAQVKRDRAKADLEKAKVALNEHEKALANLFGKGTRLGPSGWDRGASGYG